MHLTDIVGWACDGAAYCTDHKPVKGREKVHPIFVADEGWEKTTCDECLETLGSLAGVAEEM